MNHNISRLFYISGDEKPVTSSDKIKFNKNLNDFNHNADDFKSYNNYFIANYNEQFELTTNYPGLLPGAGYSHPALKDPDPDNKNDVSDFQLGFFFDHTTGLPVIPGSSVKGVLKSVFPKDKYSYGNEKLKYIQDIVGGSTNKDASFIDGNNWEEIFFGSTKAKRNHIFHDAYVSGIQAACRLFEDDYITPHTKDIYKNPTPIRFLKVGPGVSFTFQFRLFNYKDKNGNVLLSSTDIKEIFKKILSDWGIGAKRNVGYGQFK
ncbi:MAG: type III-B CRISPR module RAMP protein Cmr6 [Ignavibacteriaceae bacterium]|jgi:CRISPR-associated protein Cmr6